MIDAYTFDPAITVETPPTITSINPTEGDATGGTTVEIIGENFVNTGMSTYFGSSPAPAISYTDSTHLNGTTPSHATGSVDLIVINPNGWWGMSSDAYTYTSAGGGGCDPNSLDPNQQCAEINIGCSTVEPYITSNPTDFGFLTDGTDAVRASSSAQKVFSSPTGSPIDSATNFIGIADIRDPSITDCNNGLTLTIHLEDQIDGDNIYFDADTINSGGYFIPINELYLLSSNSSCPTGWSSGTSGLCFEDTSQCGNGNNLASTLCTGDEGIANASYSGTNFALWDTFTSINKPLGIAENTPAGPITIMEFDDGNELFGTAGLNTAFGVNIPAGTPGDNIFTTNFVYTIISS